MRYTLAQLRKRQSQDNQFEETLDFSSFLEDNTDFLAVSPVSVKGHFTIEADRYYHFHMGIRTTITMACAITLKPVDIDLDFHVVETFSTDSNDEYHQVEGITVDLLPIIWSNIYLEKPLRVVAEGAEYKNPEKPKKPQVNPSFKDLEKYKR